MKIKSYKPILLIFAFIFITFLSFFLLFEYYDRQAIQEVSSADLENFGVLIFYDGNVKFVFGNSIKDFTQKHPNYSFLVSKDEEKQLKKQFTKTNTQAFASFEVERFSKDTQNFHISFKNDGETAFWYEARDKEVFPKKVKSYGPGFIFAPCGLAMFIAIVSTCLLSFGIKIVRKHKENSLN